MNTNELEQSEAHITVEIIEYKPDAVTITKTILKKSTGNLSAISFDSSEGLEENISKHDTFVQMIEGKAEFVIDGTAILLQTGQSIIIPANKVNLVKPSGRIKMISTIVRGS